MVCEACINCVEQNNFGELTPADFERIAIYYGNDLPDHFCEIIENSEVICQCNCVVNYEYPII